MEPRLEMDFGGDEPPLRAGLVWVEGLVWLGADAAAEGAGQAAVVPEPAADAGPAGAVAAPLPAATSGQLAGDGFAWPPERKSAVRDMLRHGKYKPAGRAKPSSEYLLQAALDGDFPRINAAVDAANLVSLRFGYPISLVDPDRTGPRLTLRRGRAGESYIFNSSGQSIDVEDLVCACRSTESGIEPCANPVRDSMATKLFPGARAAAAIIYAPAGPEGDDLEKACAELAALLGACAEGTPRYSIFR